ncbi:hypothetical protein [Halocola ammonii]
MKRLLLFTIAFFGVFLMSAQSERHEVGFRLSPGISVFGDFSRPIPGLSADLFYSYRLGKSTFIESGLKYAQISHEYLGPIEMPLLRDKRIISEGFVEIPIILRLSLYQGSNPRFNADILAGYSFGFKVNHFHLDVYSEEAHIRKVDWREESNYLHFIQTGFNFSYRLKNNLTIGLRPQVRIPQGFEWYQPANLLIPELGISISQKFGKQRTFED